jgi:hypothetical protein
MPEPGQPPDELISLNDRLIEQMPLDELEARLRLEELDERANAWACSCDSQCGTYNSVY